MKVFRMNDCDWMAGEDLESCKEEYKTFYGHDNDEEAFDDPGEVSPEVMQKFQFLGERGEADEGTRSFQAELDRLIESGATFPRFFASSEY